MRRPKLYETMAERVQRGVFPLFEELESKLSDEDLDKLIRCMNSAFDAGQVEFQWELDMKLTQNKR